MKEEDWHKLTDNMILLSMYNKKLIKPDNDTQFLLNPKIKVMGTILFYGPTQMSEISSKLCVTKPHITKLIDELIVEGMVKRLYDEKDRRVIRIDLTSKGKQFLIKHRDETSQNIKEKTSKLNPSDLKELVKSSDDMIKILSKVYNECDISKVIERLKTGS